MRNQQFKSSELEYDVMHVCPCTDLVLCRLVQFGHHLNKSLSANALVATGQFYIKVTVMTMFIGSYMTA